MKHLRVDFKQQANLTIPQMPTENGKEIFLA